MPKFKGGSPIQNQIIRGVNKTKLNAFRVNEKLDSGRIIIQKKVKITKYETVKTLSKKILVQEHKLYPKAILKVFNL